MMHAGIRLYQPLIPICVQRIDHIIDHFQPIGAQIVIMRGV